MSPMDRSLPSTAQFASHERLRYIFEAAPYLRTAFIPFIERFPESMLLETDRVYLAICTLYLVGRRADHECWLTAVDEVVDLDGIYMVLQLIRYSRRKRDGQRLWTITRKIWRDILGESLPVKRSHSSLELTDLDEERMYLRTALATCLARLFQIWDMQDAPKPAPSKEHRPSVRAKSTKKHSI